MHARPLTGPTHTIHDERRIEAYRIRLDLNVSRSLLITDHPNGYHSIRRNPDPLTLRGPDGKIDAQLIAIESTMRHRAGIRSYVAELDMPPEHRHPAPWNYCRKGPVCRLCTTAYRVGLPDAHPTLWQRIRTALAAMTRRRP